MCCSLRSGLFFVLILWTFGVWFVVDRTSKSVRGVYHGEITGVPLYVNPDVPVTGLSIRRMALCDEATNAILGQYERCVSDRTCVKCASNYDNTIRMLRKFHSRDQTRRTTIRRRFSIRRPLVVMAVNGGQFDFFLNWLTSVQRLKLDVQCLLLAVDYVAYERSMELSNIPGLFVTSPNMTNPDYVVSPKYNPNVANAGAHTDINNLLFVETRELIDMGYTVLMSDVDTVWLRDPFPFLEAHSNNMDLMCMYSHYHHSKSPCNTGFMYVRPTVSSKALWSTLENMLPIKRISDQHLFNAVIRHHRFRGILYRALPLNYFCRAGSTSLFSVNDTMVYHPVSIGKKERLKSMNLWFL